MKVKDVGVLLLLFVSPLLSFPLILIKIYRGEKNSVYFAAIWFGIFSFCFPPVADLYEHTKWYYDYQGASWNSFLSSLDGYRSDVVTQFVSYKAATLGIPFPFVRLLYQTIQVSILGWLYNDTLLKLNTSKVRKFGLYLFLIAYSNILGSITGVRFGLSVTFVLLGFYLLYIRGKSVRGVIFLLIASSIHFAVAPHCIIIVIFYILKIRISFLIFIIGMIISVTVGLYIVSYYLSGFDELAGYVDGYWGKEYTASFRGMVFYYITLAIPIVTYFYFVMSCKKSTTPQIRSIIYVLLMIFTMTLGLRTISMRFGWLTQVIVSMYVLLNINIHHRRSLNMCILSGVLLMCIHVYDARNRFILHNNYTHEMWKPLPILLTKDYDQRWINTHLDYQGNF